MTAPNAHVDCKCSHSKTLHPAANDEACRVPTCGCEEYRPSTAPDLRGPASAPVVAPVRQIAPGGVLRTEPSIEQVLAAGRRSPRTLKLANRIAADVDRLRLRVTEDRDVAAKQRARDQERTDALAEVDRLKIALAAARAKARGDRTPPQSLNAAGRRGWPVRVSGLRPGVRDAAGCRPAPRQGPWLPEGRVAA